MNRTTLLSLWLIADLLIFIGSYALAYFLRVGFIFSSDFPFSQFITAVLIVSPVWLLSLIGTRTYALMRNQKSVRTISYIIFAGLLGMSLFTLTFYFLYGLFFSRLMLVYALAFSIGFTTLGHIVFDALMKSALRGSIVRFPTLIIGATREAAALIQRMKDERSPLVPVAVLDGRGSKEKDLCGVPVEGKLNKLEETMESYKVTHLIQCSDIEQSLNLLSACKNRGIVYMLLPSVMGMVEGDERIESLVGKQMTVVRPKKGMLEWLFA